MCEQAPQDESCHRPVHSKITCNRDRCAHNSQDTSFETVGCPQILPKVIFTLLPNDKVKRRFGRTLYRYTFLQVCTFLAGEFPHIRLKGVRKVAYSTLTRGKADMYALRGSYARHKPHARPSHQNAARAPCRSAHQHHVGFRRRGCGRNMALPPEDFRRCSLYDSSV